MESTEVGPEEVPSLFLMRGRTQQKMEITITEREMGEVYYSEEKSNDLSHRSKSLRCQGQRQNLAKVA